MIILKARWEIQKMQKSNAIVAQVLERLKEITKPGMTTLELDRFAEEL